MFENERKLIQCEVISHVDILVHYIYYYDMIELLSLLSIKNCPAMCTYWLTVDDMIK